MASQGLTNPWSQTRLRLKNEGASDFQLFLLVGTSGSGNCSHGSITEEVGEVRVMEISLACVELIDIIIEILVFVERRMQKVLVKAYYLVVVGMDE
eukprot:scaffold476_cov77-Skeletonema_marinoi.AAC.3